MVWRHGEEACLVHTEYGWTTTDLAMSKAAWRASRLLGVFGDAGEVEEDGGLVAGDPGVVAGGHVEEVAGAVLDLGAVVHLDGHFAFQDIAGVGGLAGGGVDDGLNVLGPFPAGLESADADGGFAELENVELAFAVFEGTGFIGGRGRFANEFLGHWGTSLN